MSTALSGLKACATRVNRPAVAIHRVTAREPADDLSAPALTGSKLDSTKSLKDAGRGAPAGARKLRLRSALVVAQVALSLVLLTGAGLMVTTMRHLQAVDPGFKTEQLLTFRISLSGDRYLQDAGVDGAPKTDRMALGAGRGDVVRLVTSRGPALGAGGVAFGLMGAFWLTDLMRTFSVDFEGVSVLYGISARDPATFAMVSALLVGTVLLACYGPTRVVSQVDAMRALRHE